MRLRRGGASDLGDVCGFTRLGTDLVLEIRSSQAPTPESVALSRDILCACASHPLTESVSLSRSQVFGVGRMIPGVPGSNQECPTVCTPPHRRAVGMRFEVTQAERPVVEQMD